MLGCVRAWLVDSIVRVADSLSFSLFLLLFFSFLVSWVCGVWMVARWVVVCVGTIADCTLGVV